MKAMPVLFEYFHERPPSGSPQLPDNAAILNKMAGVFGLLNGLVANERTLIQFRLSTLHQMKALMIQHWKHVRRWVKYFLLEVLEPGLYPDSPTWRMFSQLVGNLLALFAADDAQLPDLQAGDLITGCPRYVYWVCRYWVHVSQSRLGELSECPMRAVVECIGKGRNVDRENQFDGLLAALHDVPEWASLTLQHLRRITNCRSPSTDLSQIGAVLAIPISLCRAIQNSRLHFTAARRLELCLAKEGMTEQLTTIMFRIQSTLEAGSLPNRGTITSLHSAFELWHLSYCPGPGYIEDFNIALKHGLLPCVMDLSSRLVTYTIPGAQECVVELARFLRRLAEIVLHPQILRVLDQQFPMIQPLDFRWVSNQSPQHIKDMAGSWENLEQTLTSRIDDRREYKTERRKYCSNKMCEVSMTVKALKQCGWCASAHYCSRKCQKRHWKSEHKNECGISITPQKTYRLERDFACWIVKKHFLCHEAQIGRDIIGTAAEDGKLRYIVGMSFDVNPTRWTVMTEKMFLEIAGLREFVEEAARVLGQRKGNDLLVLALLPGDLQLVPLLQWTSTFYLADQRVP